ncbi:outer membrane murein-binding lipoprotein Lpp [Bradyrhizobium sp. USDA 4516]
MSGDDASSVNAALLQMAAKIGGLESTVATLLHTWTQMEAKASDGRKDLHQKVDALRAEMTTMGAQLATATKDIADMKPTVQAVQNVQVQATGVRNASRWLYWLAVLLSGGVGWILTSFVDFHVKR